MIHTFPEAVARDTIAFVNVIMTFETTVLAQTAIRAADCRDENFVEISRRAVQAWLIAETAAERFVQTCLQTPHAQPRNIMIRQILTVLRWEADTMGAMTAAFGAAARAAMAVPDGGRTREQFMHALHLLDQLLEMQISILGLDAVPADPQ